MFGELIAEELHRTLSHISCTPASVASFGELAGCKSELTCCATWVPKMHMANLGIFWVVWVPGAQKRWKHEFIGMYMRENGTICPFGVFIPRFYRIFRVKIGHFKCVWSVERDKRWAWAGPINSRNAYKTRENQKRPQSASSQGLASKWTKHNF